MIDINGRIKKKKFRQICDGYTNKKQRDANKALCKRYPFLIPRQEWSDKIVWLRKPYDWTLVDEFPKGWWKAFGLQICEELREECIKYDYLHQLRLEQIKEKFGSLRIFTGLIPMDSQIDHIISDYSALSENVCITCGKPDTYMLNIHGWLTPICEECFNKTNNRRIKNGYQPIYTKSYNEYICNKDDGVMPSERTVTTYRNGESKQITYDLKAKAEKIRARWRAKHERMSEV